MERKDPVQEFAEKYNVPEEIVRKIVNAARRGLIELDPETAIRALTRYGSVENVPIRISPYTVSDEERLAKIVKQGWTAADLTIVPVYANWGGVRVRVSAPNGVEAIVDVLMEIPPETELNKDEWLRYHAIKKLAERLAEKLAEKCKQREDESA